MTTTSTTTTSSSSTLRDRIRAEEHRFTSLTQNLTHFSPLKVQLDKHNITIEKLEADIAKRNNIMRRCQDKLKTLAKRPSSKQSSRVSVDAVHAHSAETNEAEETLAKHQRAKEELEALNGQLLAAKILHIGLTRQVAQYFESKGELQALLEKIFVGSTPEHPDEDELEREIGLVEREMGITKNDFDRVRLAKKELKEVKRYLDIWNDTMEKQLASQPKDVSKSLKKLVPFFGPKAPSYTKVADQHYKEARTQVPSIENIGNMSDISMENTAITSSELILYTSKFNHVYTALTKQMEDLHKKHKDLRTKRAQRMESLFDRRCRIFSEELQEYYRSVGASLAAGGSIDGPVGVDADSVTEDMGLTQESRALSGLRRLHVEDETGAAAHMSGPTATHSSESDATLPLADELPSYWQYHQDGGAVLEPGQMTLTTSSRNSTMSSTTSINTPVGYSSGTNGHHPHYRRSGETFANPPGYATGDAEPPAQSHDDEMFAEYHRRYDTRYAGATDTPPCYEEAAPMSS
ncbi:hypothetical protein DFQ27_007331 [Actinomortierella ambigua]|uniref:Uncharacterized protein n=1 Tax=Actinomortierella ambigua TaxID=1343610 RepID=A0A9P6PV22_9FUNG|nr:hypothetical protein DFQ27_007331 [Actinomortierella ambigua]